MLWKQWGISSFCLQELQQFDLLADEEMEDCWYTEIVHCQNTKRDRNSTETHIGM